MVMQNYNVQQIALNSMEFPLQIQQKIEKLASSQGISIEQFVLQAVTEKIDALTQKKVELSKINSSNQAKVYRKEGILVVDAELAENLDFNNFIDELREERIWDQMAV